MKNIKIFLIAFIATLVISGLSTAEMYKYVDENGVVHFQDSPPENVGADVEIKSIPTSNGGDYNGSKPKSENSERTLPWKNGYSNAKVELYVTSWCTYCKQAANYFRSKGITFTEYNIEKDKAALLRKKKLDKRQGVPFAVVNGQKIHGFMPQAYENALKKR